MLTRTEKHASRPVQNCTLQRMVYCVGNIIVASRDEWRKCPGQFTVVPMTEDSFYPKRLLEQTRLGILSWKPGPRRGREGAIEEHMAVKLARDCSSRSDSVSQARVPHESHLHYPFRWLCFRHLSLRHLCQVHLPPRRREWAASGRERRTVRMGTTSRHLPCLALSCQGVH